MDFQRSFSKARWWTVREDLPRLRPRRLQLGICFCSIFCVASFAVRAATFSALLFYPRLQPDLPAFQRHDVFQLLGALASLQLLRLPSQEFPEVLLR